MSKKKSKYLNFNLKKVHQIFKNVLWLVSLCYLPELFCFMRFALLSHAFRRHAVLNTQKLYYTSFK